jgi:hypothetical protein
MTVKLWLAPYIRSKHQLSMAFGVNDLRFSTSYWYGDVDLLELEHRFGVDYMEKVYFHLIAFEANKLTSLKPEVFDLGPFERYHTPEFEELWLTIHRHVWAQWRYENNLPDYAGPRFLSQPIQATAIARQVANSNEHVLLFCGGGKDSLVALKILERAGISYSTCAYSSSIYGQAKLQHQLIEALLNTAKPQVQHNIWIYDDFLDSPVTKLAKEYQVTSLTAAETPSSIFAAVPIILQNNYRYLGFGHERSADVPNLIWDQTGEAVNHQWGKSSQAEQLIGRYLQNHLLTNCQYFSLLKPIYDVVIFNMLRQDLASVPFTHSCNITKPWCKRCAKCAYVWLNYMAYLPVDVVNQMFQVNLFDLPENQLWFRQMLGLEKHSPFECIGQINESRLAFELCRRKGFTGKAMQMFVAEVKDFDFQAAVNEYVTVNHEYSSIPVALVTKILAQLELGAKISREYIDNLLRS